MSYKDVAVCKVPAVIQKPDRKEKDGGDPTQ